MGAKCIASPHLLGALCLYILRARARETHLELLILFSAWWDGVSPDLPAGSRFFHLSPSSMSKRWGGAPPDLPTALEWRSVRRGVRGLPRAPRTAAVFGHRARHRLLVCGAELPG